MGALVSLRRALPSIVGNLVLAAVLIGVGFLYASSGSSARDQLVTETLVTVVMVLGVQVFVGNTGVLSFGHLGFASLAAYVTALLAIPAAKKEALLPKAPFGVADMELGIFWATLIGVAFALVIGVLLGVVVSRTVGLAATMITLAFLFVVEAVTKNWRDMTNGAGNLSGIPRLEGRAWPLLLAGAAIVIAAWFRNTRAGRLAQATREDELAASAMGIRLANPRLIALVLSAGLVGLGGSLRSQSLGVISPSQFSFDFTILVLAMLVVGGMRTVSGAVVGTVIITAGSEFTRFLGDGPTWLGIDWPTVEGLPELFRALVLLAVLLLRPSGLLGDWDAERWFARLRVRSTAPGTSLEPTVAGATSGALEARQLGVRFGGFTAVDDVSLRVEPGQIRGLIGPNGAGKTTFVNLVTGIVPPTSGTVHLGDSALPAAPFKVARAGLARTFQNLRVFGNLSVRENIEIAALVAERHRTHRPEVSVDSVLAMSGLAELADRPASTLDYGNQRRLEIARAAALRPDFLLLDEPTSGMSDDESQAMIGHVRATAALCGAGVLVIDHDLGFITSICDRITVLDQGSILAEGTPEEVRRNPEVIAAYLGSQG